jgi:hypothetical protein
MALALLLVTVFSKQGRAEGFERIRPESALLTSAMTTAFERSATFRSFVERIEQSDVIVHLTCGRFKSGTLAGQTSLGSAGPAVRYVRVQVLCELSQPVLVGILAHELQHVVEIASTPSVVDNKSFARLFSTIGFSTCLSVGREQFETSAAMAAGERVRSEFIHSSESGVQASHRFAGPVDRRSGD